jgi:DNA-binding MltR family transcriptional regulator
MDFNQFDSFVEDLLAEKNNRNIIIIGASKIDDLLYSILLKFFLPKPSKGKQQDELLEGDTPLGTFSSRIKILYRLGIIDFNLYTILERIRSIRNKSAHSIEFNLKKSPIKDNILDLKRLIIQRNSFIKTSQRYFGYNKLDDTIELQCMIITICVLLEAIYEKIYKTNGNKETLSISIK